LLLVVLMGLSSTVFAQVELKVNPIGALFGLAAGSVELVVGRAIGVEAMGSYKFPLENSSIESRIASSAGFELSGLLKLYFNPDQGGDGYYFFPYVIYIQREVDFKDDVYGDITTIAYHRNGDYNLNHGDTRNRSCPERARGCGRSA